MPLTRTEALILDKAVELFHISTDAIAAAGDADPAGRPQIGELLVQRGVLDESQLERVLDAVFENLRAEGDKLAVPVPRITPRAQPAPLPPRPRSGPTSGGEVGLADLVGRLDSLLARMPAPGEARGATEPPATGSPLSSSQRRFRDRATPKSGDRRLDQRADTLLERADALAQKTPGKTPPERKKTPNGRKSTPRTFWDQVSDETDTPGPISWSVASDAEPLAPERPRPASSAHIRSEHETPALSRQDLDAGAAVAAPPAPEPAPAPAPAPPAPASPPPHPHTPRVEDLDADAVPSLDKYELLEEVGRGGMGIVYKARQKGLGRTVCIKVMRDGARSGPETRLRFLREAEAAARLQHTGIVQVHEVGEQQGRCYFSMDFVDGQDLSDHVREAKPTTRKLVEILARIADAVHYAHMRGVIHRDLKPANVMIDREGEPHVMDFGIAKTLDLGDGSSASSAPMTQEGDFIGTPQYMAPEQAQGTPSEIDVRTDVYALGAMAYELFTGHYPFDDDKVFDLLNRIVNEDPPPPSAHRPDIDSDLETIILKAMEKEKERRYQSALELRHDLDRWLAGDPVVARRASVAYVWRKRAAKHKAVAVTAALGLVGVVAAGSASAVASFRDHMLLERDVDARLEKAQALLAQEKWEDALVQFGRVQALEPRNERARAGQIEAALRLAERSIAEGAPGRAEFVLRQVEALGLREKEVAAALETARRESRRLVEVGVERQRRFQEETRAILAEVAALPATRELTYEEEQGYAFDLVSRRDPETVPVLVKALAGTDARVRTVVARALGWMREPEAVSALSAILADAAAPERLRVVAAEALGWIGGAEAQKALLAARAASDAVFRARTDDALRRVARDGTAAVSSGPSDVSSLFQEADRLRQAGDPATAIARYTDALEAAPDAVEGYLGRGLARMALGQLAEAESDLDRVEAAGGPTLGAALLNRAEVRRRRGDTPGALRDLDALVRLDPTRADARLARGLIQLQTGHAAEAAAELDLALQARPDYLDARAARAEARLARGDAKGAASDIDAALAAQPDRPDFLIVRARVHAARGEGADALADAGRALEVRPDFTAARLFRARRLLEGKRFAEARAEADLVLAALAPGAPLDQERLEALNLRGIAALEARDVKSACADFRRLVAAAPALASASYNLACAEAVGGDAEAALGDLEAAVAKGWPAGPKLREDPELASLRGRPRFEALADTKKNP